MSDALLEFIGEAHLDKAVADEFLNALDYGTIDATSDTGRGALAKKLEEKPGHVPAFYLRREIEA